MLGLDGFELNGNFLARDAVGSEINIVKGTGTDLATDAVFITDTEILEF